MKVKMNTRKTSPKIFKISYRYQVKNMFGNLQKEIKIRIKDTSKIQTFHKNLIIKTIPKFHKSHKIYFIQL